MRLGVIGCGSAGSRHARNLSSMGHDLTLFDVDPSKAEALRSELGADRAGVVGGVGELFDSAVEACVIASPTDSHKEYAAAALQRGVPAFVEKPLALTHEEALGIAELQATSRVPLMVGYNLRFFAPVERVKDALDAEEIGRPLAASFWFGHDLRLWRPHVDYRATYSAEKRRGGGVLLEVSHEIDLAHWLFGEVESAFGFVRRTGVLDTDPEDLAVAVLETRSGVVVSLFLDMISPGYRRGFEIITEGGAMSWRRPGGELLVFRSASGGGRPERRTRPASGTLDDSYRSELAHFLQCIRTGRYPRPDVADGLHVLAVVEAISSSSITRSAVKVPSAVQDPEGERPWP